MYENHCFKTQILKMSSKDLHVFDHENTNKPMSKQNQMGALEIRFIIPDLPGLEISRSKPNGQQGPQLLTVQEIQSNA